MFVGAVLHKPSFIGCEPVTVAHITVESFMSIAAIKRQRQIY
jgi:hypothetical protein